MTGVTVIAPRCAAGDQVFTWTKRPTNLDCFLIGTAYWTSHRIHYDREWAQAEGYADVVVTGVLLYAWLEKLIVQWAGSPHAVRAYKFRHTGLPTVDDDLVFTGTVADVVLSGDQLDVTLTLDVHTATERSILVGECRLGFSTADGV